MHLWTTDQTVAFNVANINRKLGGEPGSGVREPRRPITPSSSGAIAVDPGESDKPTDRQGPADGGHRAA